MVSNIEYDLAITPDRESSIDLVSLAVRFLVDDRLVLADGLAIDADQQITRFGFYLDGIRACEPHCDLPVICAGCHAKVILELALVAVVIDVNTFVYTGVANASVGRNV